MTSTALHLEIRNRKHLAGQSLQDQPLVLAWAVLNAVVLLSMPDAVARTLFFSAVLRIPPTSILCYYQSGGLSQSHYHPTPFASHRLPFEQAHWLDFVQQHHPSIRAIVMIFVPVSAVTYSALQDRPHYPPPRPTHRIIFVRVPVRVDVAGRHTGCADLDFSHDVVDLLSKD